MASVPYARILMSVNGGAFSAGARTVPSGATIALKGESVAAWNNGAKWEIFGAPPNNDQTDWTGPGDPDWSYDPTDKVWRSTSITPAAFTLPPDTTIWGKWLLRLVVNNGIDPTTRTGPQTDPAGNLLPNQVIDISGGWSVLSPNAGLVDVGIDEGDQFNVLSYVRELQYTLRTIDAGIGSSGGTVTMGGDVMGPSSNATVGKLRGVSLDASMSSAADGSFIQKLSGSWKPVSAATVVAALTLVGDVNGAANANHVDTLTGTSNVVTLVSTTTIKQTQGGTIPSPTAEYPIVLQPRDPSKAPFHVGYLAAATFNSTVDVTMAVGYNVDLNNADAAIYWRLEQDYEVTPGTHWFEYYIEYASAGAHSSFIRPIYINVDKVTNVGQMIFELPSPTTGGSIAFTSGDLTQTYCTVTNTNWRFRNNYIVAFNDSTVTARNGLTVTSANYMVISDAALIGTVLAGGSDGVYIESTGTVKITDAAVVTRVSIETTHGLSTFGGGGSDFKAVVGPWVGAETSGAAVYLVAGATSLGLANAALVGDGANTYLSAPSASGVILFYSQLSTVLGAFDTGAKRFYAGGSTSAAPFIVDWATPNATQFFTGTSQTLLQFGTVSASATNIQFGSFANVGSDVAPGNITFTPQGPWASAATNLTSGDFVVNIPSSVGGGTKRGGIVVEYNGDPNVRLGSFANGTYGAMWCMDGGTPTTSNYALLGRSNETYFGVPTAGTMYFGFANAHFPMIMTQSSVSIGDFGAANIVFDAMTTSAAMHFPEGATSATIQRDTRTSDVATRDILIVGETPYASATGTNRHPGNVVVKTPLPITGDSFFGGLVWERGDGSVGWRLGYYGGPDLTYTGMWFEDGGSPSGTSYAFLGTSTRTDLNAQSGLNLCIASAYQINISGTTSMSMITNSNVTGTFAIGTNVSAGVLDLRSHTNASTLYLDAGNDVVVIGTSELRWKGGNTPLIDQEQQSGSTDGVDFTIIAQQGHSGFNGGRLVLQGGLAGSAPATSGNVAVYSGSSLVYTAESPNGTLVISRDYGIAIGNQITKSTNYTIDASGAGDEEIWMTGACTITLPDPTSYTGRHIRIFVDYDPTASSGTIARHGGEKINGATSNLTLGAAHKFSCLVVGTNGTDWVIGLAAKA